MSFPLSVPGPGVSPPTPPAPGSPRGHRFGSRGTASSAPGSHPAHRRSERMPWVMEGDTDGGPGWPRVTSPHRRQHQGRASRPTSAHGDCSQEKALYEPPQVCKCASEITQVTCFCHAHSCGEGRSRPEICLHNHDEEEDVLLHSSLLICLQFN